MLKYVRYSLDSIRDEACELVRKGIVDRKQPIYALCQFLPTGEWEAIECELERNDFLLRDQILDLIGCEDWREDWQRKEYRTVNQRKMTKSYPEIQSMQKRFTVSKAFKVIEHSTHRLASGQEIACVKMRKMLRSD